MHEKNLVAGLPTIHDAVHVCEICQMGKNTRLPFGDTNWRATEKLQLIHSDVWTNDRRYSLTFIDDYSCMCWVYFLKQKSEVLSQFTSFKTLVEKQTGHSIKILRTDN